MGGKHYSQAESLYRWDKKHYNSHSGSVAYANTLAKKYKLKPTTTTKIKNILEAYPSCSPNLEKTLVYFLNNGGERLLCELFENKICPPACEVEIKSQIFKDNDSYLSGSIESMGQILRSDVSPSVLRTLIALQKGAFDKVDADRIGMLLKSGVTLESDVLLEKVGFCLLKKMTAEDILSRPKILSDLISVELIKAAFDEPALQSEVNFLDIDRIIEIMEVTPIAPTKNYVSTERERFAYNIKGRSFVKKHCK